MKSCLFYVFAVSIMPIAGVTLDKWIGETFVLFTNKFVHIVNFNDLGKKVDSFKIELRYLSNIIYYKGKKSSVFKINFENCDLVIAPKKSFLKETNEFLSKKFSVTTKEEEFQNKKLKYLNTINNFNLIIALTSIAICILVLMIKRS